MNAVIYARYSSERQNDKSIDDQVRECSKYAEQNGFNIVGVYADRAKTGRNDNRPEFQKMIHDSKRKNFKIVLCWKLDRIGRNAGDYYINERKLLDNGVKIESITEQIPDGPVASILKGVYVGQAESYSVSLGINVLRGMESNARQCKSCGSMRPFGYLIDDDKNFIPDPERAPFVAEMFDMFVNRGMMYKQISDYMNDRGFKTLKDKPFTGNYVKRILRNPKYKGTFKFGETVIENGIPALVDASLFDKAQALMDSYHTYKPRQKGDVFMLLGKLYCGNCGAMMIADGGTSRSGKVYHYYACKSRKKHLADCDVKPIRKDELDAFVIQKTQEYILTDEVIGQIVQFAMKLQQQSDDAALVSKLEKDLKEKQKQIDNLMELLMDGWASDEIKSKLGDLEDEKKSIETALTVAEMNVMEIDRDAMEWRLREYREIESIDDSLAREMIDSLINSVIVDNETITIVYNFSGNKKDTESFPLEIIRCSNNLQLVDQFNIKLNTYDQWFYLILSRKIA